MRYDNSNLKKFKRIVVLEAEESSKDAGEATGEDIIQSLTELIGRVVVDEFA